MRLTSDAGIALSCDLHTEIDTSARGCKRMTPVTRPSNPPANSPAAVRLNSIRARAGFGFPAVVHPTLSWWRPDCKIEMGARTWWAECRYTSSFCPGVDDACPLLSDHGDLPFSTAEFPSTGTRGNPNGLLTPLGRQLLKFHGAKIAHSLSFGLPSQALAKNAEMRP